MIQRAERASTYQHQITGHVLRAAPGVRANETEIALNQTIMADTIPAGHTKILTDAGVRVY